MRLVALLSTVACLALMTGCETIPPGAERGPHGTMAYEVLVESSPPGVEVQANGEFAGTTPFNLKIFGDPDGTFHDFGEYQYVLEALPQNTNQFLQIQAFQTGRMFSPQDYIPRRIYFNMTQPPPVYIPEPYPVYYPDPFYHGYWGPGFYFGPTLHVRPRPPLPRIEHRPHIRR